MASAYTCSVEQPGGESRDHSAAIVDDGGAQAQVRVDDRTLTLALQPLPDGRVAVDVGGVRRRLRVVDEGDAVLIVDGARQWRVQVSDARARLLRGAGGGADGGGQEVRAAMPGRVVRLPIAVGSAVEPGQVVAVLEAMKMENDVKARVAGVVRAIHVAEGDAVEQKALLLSIGVAS